MNNNNDRIQRSNYILLGLVILMLLYGVIYRFMSGDDSLYIFGIPVIPGSNKEETTQEEPAGGDASSESSRALLQAIDEMLDVGVAATQRIIVSIVALRVQTMRALPSIVHSVTVAVVALGVMGRGQVANAAHAVLIVNEGSLDAQR